MALTDITDKNTDQKWQIQRICSDVEDYELIVEKEKTEWECEQKRESWKWSVSYHGSIVARGSVNSSDEAMIRALENVPNQE